MGWDGVGVGEGEVHLENVGVGLWCQPHSGVAPSHGPYVAVNFNQCVTVLYTVYQVYYWF